MRYLADNVVTSYITGSVSRAMACDMACLTSLSGAAKPKLTESRTVRSN